MLPIFSNSKSKSDPIIKRVSVLLERNGINNLADKLQRSRVDNGKNVVAAEDLKQLLKSNDFGLTTQEAINIANEFTRNDSKGKPIIDLD